MRIAVVGQNNLKNDARVLKEIYSLEKLNMEIHAFGLDQIGSKQRLPGLQTYVKLVGLKRIMDFYARLRRLVAGVLLAFVAYFLFYGVFYLTALLAVGASSFALIMCLFFGLLYLGKSRLKKFEQNLLLMPVKALTSRFIYKAYTNLLLSALESGAPYDVVHCHDIIGLKVGALYKQKFPRARLIWDAHEIYDDMANVDKKVSKFHKAVIRQAAHYVDGFITINDSLANYYRVNYPSLPQAKVVMNATLETALPPYDNRLHLALGVTPEKKILLFQGGFSGHRGIEELLLTVDLLDENWIIVFMGWGNLEKDIRLAMANNSKVKFLPPAPQNELHLWTQGATIGAITYSDGFINHKFCTPNKLWEYPNANVPVIVSPLQELKVIVEKWDIGIVLNEGFTHLEIADAINNLTSETMQNYKENCTTFIKEMSWERFEPNLYHVYELNYSMNFYNENEKA